MAPCHVPIKKHLYLFLDTFRGSKCNLLLSCAKMFVDWSLILLSFQLEQPGSVKKVVAFQYRVCFQTSMVYEGVNLFTNRGRASPFQPTCGTSCVQGLEKVSKEVLDVRLGVVLHHFPGIWDLETGRTVVCLAESFHCYWKWEISSGATGSEDAFLKARIGSGRSHQAL